MVVNGLGDAGRAGRRDRAGNHAFHVAHAGHRIPVARSQVSPYAADLAADSATGTQDTRPAAYVRARLRLPWRHGNGMQWA